MKKPWKPQIVKSSYVLEVLWCLDSKLLKEALFKGLSVPERASPPILAHLIQIYAVTTIMVLIRFSPAPALLQCAALMLLLTVGVYFFDTCCIYYGGG